MDGLWADAQKQGKKQDIKQHGSLVKEQAKLQREGARGNRFMVLVL
jgi:hypothetical protein